MKLSHLAWLLSIPLLLGACDKIAEAGLAASNSSTNSTRMTAKNQRSSYPIRQSTKAAKPVGDVAAVSAKAADKGAQTASPSLNSGSTNAERSVFFESSADTAPEKPDVASPQAAQSRAAIPEGSDAKPDGKVPASTAPAPRASPVERSAETPLLSKRQAEPLPQKRDDVVLAVKSLPSYWDGDQTTGGLWVALPNLRAERRVVLTNPETGQQVVAKLFWRDPQAGGGATLLSSDAAVALGMAPRERINLSMKIIKAD